MKILEQVKHIFRRIIETIDNLYERLPLDKWNDYLHKKSIKIDLKSIKFKIFVRSLCAIVLLYVLSALFPNSASSRDYEIIDACFCQPLPVRLSQTPVDERDLGSFDGYAYDGDLKSVKYFVKNHYDQLKNNWSGAITAALNGGHIDVAEYLYDKQPEKDTSSKVWEDRLSHALNNYGTCDTLKFVLKHGKRYLEDSSEEFDPVMKSVGTICKLKICFDFGYICAKNQHYLSRAIDKCYNEIGTVTDQKAYAKNAELQMRQTVAEKILMANLELLLKHGACDFSDAVTALCRAKHLVRLKNRVKILYLFERFGYNTVLDESQMESIFSKKMIQSGEDKILKKNDSVRQALLKKWSEGWAPGASDE